MLLYYVVGLTQASVLTDLHDNNVIVIISEYYKLHTKMHTLLSQSLNDNYILESLFDSLV